MTGEEEKKEGNEKIIEQNKSMMKLPKGEHFAWSLLTGAYILFACAVLLLLQGIGTKETVTQFVEYLASLAMFALGGYFMHSYNHWLLVEMNKYSK